MTKETLKSILEHPCISKEYLEAIARAVDACDDPDHLKSEFLVEAILKVEVDRVVPWLKILPAEALEGIEVIADHQPEQEPEETRSLTEGENNPQEKSARILALREALDKSSRVNRSLGLSFVALMFYILLIIASTTDLMLFLPDEKVNLPIVDVELPLKGFYMVTPFLVLIFHFNLLINLYHHRKRFIALRKAENHNPDYDQLHPFLFNYLDRYPKRSGLRVLFRSLILISLFFFPFLNVLLMQYRFAAYHDFQISMLQMGASILSGVLMLAFYRLIVDAPENGEVSEDGGVRNARSFLPRLFGKVRKVLFVFNAAWTTSIIGFLAALLMGGIAIYLYQSKDSDNKTPSEYAWLIPSIDLTYYVDEVNQVDEGLVLKYVNDTTEVGEAKEIAIRNHGKGYQLMGRDFRYAVMPGINLCNTDAEGADFRFADLQGSRFSSANLVGVRFEGTKLMGVKMQKANLEKVNLADVDGKDLRRVNFWGANLDSVRLQDVDLSFAQLQGADLSFAQLQGADLS